MNSEFIHRQLQIVSVYDNDDDDDDDDNDNNENNNLSQTKYPIPSWTLADHCLKLMVG